MPNERIDAGKLIELLQTAGFEVMASSFCEGPTVVFGTLDNAERFIDAIAAVPK